MEIAGLAHGSRRDRLQAAYARACISYQLKPYAGKLVILIPVEKNTMLQESVSWSAWAPHAHIHFIPGDHLTALTKHVGSLANVMRPYLMAR